MKRTITICTLFALTVAAMAMFTACAKNDTASADAGAANSNGQGGSMARFAIMGDHLYTVNSTTLKVVSIADPSRLTELTDLTIGSNDIETIYPMSRGGRDYLFIGSRSAMYAYDITVPSFPQRITSVSHFVSNDPVVAYGDVAFVTLSTDANGNGVNQLNVYDISTITSPRLIETIDMSQPRGLAVDGPAGMLFVCEKRGVSAWSYTYTPGTDNTSASIDLNGLYRSGEIPAVSSIDAYDCIVLDGHVAGAGGHAGRLLVVGSDGLYQLGYDGASFTLISKIDLRKEE